MATGISKHAVGIILCIIILFASFAIGWERGKTGAYRRMKVQTDTLYICDSIIVREPVKVTEYRTRVEYVSIIDTEALDSLRTLADSLCRERDDLILRNDSLLIALEITTAHYHQDSLFDAWVSGWHPSLDSIKVYDRERLIIQRVTEYKPMRWCVGITGGIGAGRDGLTPFVGIGLTYSLTSF